MRRFPVTLNFPGERLEPDLRQDDGWAAGASATAGKALQSC